jgi:hypothetical protein
MDELKEKARRLIYKSDLRDFPVIFEMYVRAFNLVVDLDTAMSQIVSIIRTSENADTAYTMVSHYLDSIENP